jgi:hypothetical protein
MFKILFLNPDRAHTCSFYRSGGIVKDLRHQLDSNYVIDVISWPDLPTDWQMLSNYDLFMIQRPYPSSAVALCEHVKQMRIPLWLDYDDNLFNVAPENRAWQVFDDPKIKSQVKRMIQIADVVSVTNEDLKAAYLPMNKNTVVIPNAFNDTLFDVNRELPERYKTVVWRGSDTHIYDIMKYSPAISQCTNDNPEWEFAYMGYNPWFMAGKNGETPKNTNFIRAMDIMDYMQAGFELRPSVIQVPLHDNIFNRCKSNISFIEGAYWGAMSIVPEFWGEIPGTLSYNSLETYYEALRSVVAGEVDCVAQNKLGWEFVKDNLLLSKINKLRVEVIKNLV